MKRKKKAAASTPKPFWILNEKTAPPIVALGAMVVVILLTLIFHTLFQSNKDDAPTNNNSSDSSAPAITFVTPDGVTIAADVVYPAGEGLFPLAILVHEFGQDRRQWDAYHDVFLGAGIAVLTYDTRGFGQSPLAAVPTAQAAYFASMTNDLSAAVAYAQQLKNIDPTKIYTVGAGTGANIALAEAARNPAIKKIVLLSPSTMSVFGSMASAPANVLGLADQSQQAILDAVMAPLAEPKKTMITQNGGSGVTLLDKVGIEPIRQWLTP